MQDGSSQQGPPENPGWLAKLQQESWQAEILISGGGLIGAVTIFDTSGDVVEALLHGTSITPDVGFLIGPPIHLLAFLLAQAFLIHLVLRGYWIGLVGFNLVFPQGVNREKLALQGKFKSLIKSDSNTPYLIKIDGLCSLIFSFAFFIILSITGFILYVLFVAGGGELLKELTGSKVLKQTWSLTLLSFYALVLIDFLTFGYLKRARWISRFYFPVNYFVSMITLSFLHRRLYYSIVSNIRPIYILGGVSVQVLLYLLLSNVASKVPVGISPINSGKDQFLVLEEDVVTGNSLRFSFSHFPRLEEELYLEWLKSNEGGTEDSFGDIPPKAKLDLIGSAYIITIDSVQVQNLDWISTYGRVLGFRTTRLSYIADVSRLARGRHELGMKMRLKNIDYAGDSLGYFAKAYFLVDK